jgi:hypothetical protein
MVGWCLLKNGADTYSQKLFCVRVDNFLKTATNLLFFKTKKVINYKNKKDKTLIIKLKITINNFK